MSKRKLSLNKRKHERYRVPEGAYVTLKPDYLSGQIADISPAGLAFSYYASDEPPKVSSELEISFIGDGLYLDVGSRFCLDGVSFEIISDLEIDEIRVDSIPTRCCRVQFGQLTDNQKSQLKYFIQHYTAGTLH